METTRWTSFLAMFAAIVFSSWLIIGGGGETVVPQEQVTTEFFGEFEQISSIEIRSGSMGGLLRFEKEDGRWWVIADPPRPADPAAIQRIVRILGTPKKAVLQSVQATSAAKFGLEEDNAIILTYSDESPINKNKAISVMVGNSDPAGNDTFMRMVHHTVKAESIPVEYTYKVEGEVRYLIEGRLKPELWQSRYVTWIDAESLSTITVKDSLSQEGATNSFTVTSGDGPLWDVKGADAEWQVDRGAVGALLRGLAAMQASDPPAPLMADSLANFGFDSPVLTVELTDTDGDQTVVEVGKKVDDGSEYYYVRDTSDPFVYRISGYFIGNALTRPITQMMAARPADSATE